jgi:hypothetical protein
MDISSIPQDLLIARGAYSSVRAAHEDELKRLQILTGQLSAFGSQVLRWMQPADGQPEDISGLLKDARIVIDHIEQCSAMIRELAEQRTELKKTAWPK